MIHPRPNVFCLFFILLISCSDLAASIVTDETNSGVTAFVAEIKCRPMCGLRWDGIAGRQQFRLSSSVFIIGCFTAPLLFVPSATMPSATCRQLSYLACIHICNEIIL